MTPQFSTLDKILYEKSTKEIEVQNDEKKFISSIDIKHHFDINYQPDEIIMKDQPFKHVVYKTSVEIHVSKAVN